MFTCFQNLGSVIENTYTHIKTRVFPVELTVGLDLTSSEFVLMHRRALPDELGTSYYDLLDIDH